MNGTPNSTLEHYCRLGVAVALSLAGIGILTLGIIERDAYLVTAGIGMGASGGLTGWSTTAPVVPAPPVA